MVVTFLRLTSATAESENSPSPNGQSSHAPRSFVCISLLRSGSSHAPREVITTCHYELFKVTWLVFQLSTKYDRDVDS